MRKTGAEGSMDGGSSTHQISWSEAYIRNASDEEWYKPESAAALGHSKSIITVDTYTDIQAIIADCVQEIQSFIEEVHPYDHTDAEMLKSMFQEIVIVEDESVTEEDDAEQENREEAAPVIIVYDYSDVTEMDDIAEWYLEEEVA